MIIPFRAKAPGAGPKVHVRRQVPDEPRPGLLLTGLFAFFIFFHFPAFTYQLAMDIAVGRWTGSPVLKVMTISSELFAIIAILTSRSALTTVMKCWPIWILILLPFLSVLWSISPAPTLQSANTSMSTALFGLALAARMPGFLAVRFLVRVMALGCALSALWVLLFPDTAVHQATDTFQYVHAGLWRGIFSHKQGLGVFAGLTTGLLLFYNTRIFSLPILLPSIGCGLACLIGTQSTTGLVISVFAPLIFYAARFVTSFEPQARRSLFFLYGILFGAVVVLYETGIFNFVIVQVLNKSTDLTGRTSFWEIILQNFANSGKTLLGGGFNAGFAADLYEMSVDNGYIDLLLEFGYAFAPVIFGVYALLLFGGIKLLIGVSPKHASAAIFSFAIVSTVLLINVTESNFMTKNIATVLVAVAAVLIVQLKRAKAASSARPGAAFARRGGPPPLRNRATQS